ncbi:class I SAM-dependent methyltransferase [Pseudonocardia zijingensis]|jgi:demethylmenaquinone methyltransferase/2-methoxy-6-polyprenyl-1,4-benzoquinol methylase|uniref:Methyltransferase domain-containing protein n=1 Tax=Pseudonocardia zijingensis TaxID=153376 RepID=A0ABP3YRZ2_9PSEU
MSARVPDGDLDRLLAEQVAYYRAVAPEYEDHTLPFDGGEELSAALEAFRPAGHVLELACGQGPWTRQLLRHAETVTAVDASAEMIAIASSRVADDRVRFVQADVFDWRPDRRYDVVFFGFWISHVPLERFESFWALVADCLEPGGRVFFVDDAYRTPEELIEGEASAAVLRRLTDGTPHRAVKVPHRPDELADRLARIGWRVDVRATTTGPFYWGAGSLVS